MGSPSKNIARLQKAQNAAATVVTQKNITFVFGRYTPLTSLAPSSMAHQVQAHLSYLQGDAHWYFTLPLSSAYSLLSFSCS